MKYQHLHQHGLRIYHRESLGESPFSHSQASHGLGLGWGSPHLQATGMGM